MLRDWAGQPEDPPRPNPPKLLRRLLGGLPGKSGVLGGVLQGSARGSAQGLPAGVQGDCFLCSSQERALPPALPPALGRPPGTTPQHSPQHSDFPRQSPPAISAAILGNSVSGVPLAGQPNLNRRHPHAIGNELELPN